MTFTRVPMGTRLPMPSYPSNCLQFIKPHENTTERKDKSQLSLNIILVGAGLGGLATAIALTQSGHRVTVYEQTPVLGEVGAGIQIPSNSTRLLFELGLEPYLAPYVTEPDSISFRRWQSGKVIGKTQLIPTFTENFNAPYYVIHRAHFHAALCKRAQDLGIEIKLGAKAVDYDPTAGSITLQDGTVHSGDLVVAADGIKSVARNVVQGEMTFQRPGFAAYRATVDVERMRSDPAVSWILERPALNIWIGDRKHVMTYTIGAGTSFNMVLSHPDSTDPSTWDPKTALQDMKVEFQGWDAVLTKIIDMVDTTLKWPLISGSPLDRWVSGKLVILGDAAHAMLPYMSQGAAMAVEDGVALARALSKMDSANQLPETLALFERVRSLRANQMQEASLLNGHLWHFADGPLQEARDAAMEPEVLGLPFSHSPNQWSDPATQMWCYGYDTEAEIDKAWEEEKISTKHTIKSKHSVIPLIIDGEDVVLASGERHGEIANPTPTSLSSFQGATKELAIRAAESSARAFASWSKTSPVERRALLLRLAEVFRQRQDEIRQLCQDEILCGALWANIITDDGLALIEECAALTTSVLTGSIPTTQGDGYGFVFKEPLGAVLGIAPWNAPVILGLRAVLAPIAAGNVAILKGSELSPRVHYLLASLFREAGFPPGVVNFILHRPSDGAEIFEALITHRAIQKCNFTGSTQVGRIIASQAAKALKPVLLELGGKNFAIVLEDADLDVAAREIVKGAFLNNGQICMSTDLVITTTAVAAKLEAKLIDLLKTMEFASTVITPVAKTKINGLIQDALDKGAKIHTAPLPTDGLSSQSLVPTIITGVTPEMAFYETESFGPVCGVVTLEDEDQIITAMENISYGLSAAIFSNNHYRALKLAESVKTGAVHINSKTVHDEAALPHGGRGHSGWGRFGSKWGMEEFLQTKTVTLQQ